MEQISTESSDRFAFRLEPSLRERLRETAEAQAVSESDIVRSALKAYLPPEPGHKNESAYDAFMRLGLFDFDKNAPALPADLSTNKTYMEGFAKDAGEDTR